MGLTEQEQIVKAHVGAAADIVWERKLAKHKGRQFAHYEEHVDGSASVSLMSGYTFMRSPDGRVSVFPEATPSGVNPEGLNYPLFVGNSKFWHHMLSGFLLSVIEEVFRVAEEGMPSLKDIGFASMCATHHGFRITFGLIGMKPQQVRRHVAKQLYRLYDPEAFRVVATYADPLMRDCDALNVAYRLKHLDVPPGIFSMLLNVPMLRAAVNRLERVDNASATQLVKTYFNQECAPMSIMGVNTRGLMQRGVWRYFLRMKPSSIAMLNCLSPGEQLEMLALLHQSGTTPRMTALGYLISTWARVSHRNPQVSPTLYSQFIRAVHRATIKSRGIRAAIDALYHASIDDWLATNPVLTNHQANLPLTWWLEQNNLWHENPLSAVGLQGGTTPREWNALQLHLQGIRRQHMAQQSALLDGITQWHSGITSTAINGVRITALTTPEALVKEGEQMQHCVGTYATSCKRNASRIFSLSSSAGRSTLELTLDTYTRKWVLQQHYSTHNSPAPQLHQSVTNEFIRMFQDAHGTDDNDPLKPLLQKQRQELQEAARTFHADSQAPTPGSKPGALPHLEGDINLLMPEAGLQF